jgi:D-alanine-D-alanine ligase
MVSKIASVTELIDGVNAFFDQSAKQAAMLEELVVGFELTCGVIGNDTVRALPPSMAVAKGGILSIAEKFLPGEGENQTPAPLPAPVIAKVQKVMEEAFVAVGCKGYARIDCFYQDAQQSPTGKERVVILEFNTLPGMTPATCIFHQAAEVGMRPMDLIDKIVEFGFELHRHPTVTQQVEKQSEVAPAPVADVTAPRPTEENNLTMKLF